MRGWRVRARGFLGSFGAGDNLGPVGSPRVRDAAFAPGSLPASVPFVPVASLGAQPMGVDNSFYSGGVAPFGRSSQGPGSPALQWWRGLGGASRQALMDALRRPPSDAYSFDPAALWAWQQNPVGALPQPFLVRGREMG